MADKITEAQWADSQKHELGFWKVQFEQGNIEQKQRNHYYRNTMEGGSTLFKDWFAAHDFTDEVLVDIGSGPEGILHVIEGAGHKVAYDSLMNDFRSIGYDVDAHGVEVWANHAELPGEDAETVDVVFCLNVLDHTREPAKALSEILDILKPGGYFLFMVDMRLSSQLDAYHKLALTQGQLLEWLKEYDGEYEVIPHQAGNPVMQFVAVCRKP